MRELCENRWFNTDELHLLLINANTLITSQQTLIQVISEGFSHPGPPKNGQVFLFHSGPNEGRHAWKKDHLKYKLRKTQNSVQENRFFLKSQNGEIAVSICKGDEPDCVSRRACWLVKRPDIIIVHYLNEMASQKDYP